MESIEYSVNFNVDTDETTKLIGRIKEDFDKFVKGEIQELVLKNTTDYSEENRMFLEARMPVLEYSLALYEMRKAESINQQKTTKLIDFVKSQPNEEVDLIESAQNINAELQGIKDQLHNLWYLMPNLNDFQPFNFRYHASALLMLAAYIDLMTRFMDVQECLMRAKDLTPPINLIGGELDKAFVEEMLKTNQPTRH